jgi:type VI secretion system protein ImpK
MNRENHEQSGTAVIDTDEIFQDSYLLVIELLHGCTLSHDTTLRQTCIAQVEGARAALQQAGMSARNVDRVILAQCALLDEAVLARARDSVRQAWVNEPLQARFFGHHQAGDVLYEEMRQVLREPAPDLDVLTVYKRVMTLGFLGCHQTRDAEDRVDLMDQVNAFVAPLTEKQPSLVIDSSGPSWGCRRWSGSPVSRMVGAGLLLAVMWWVLSRSLADAVATLGQGGV